MRGYKLPRPIRAWIMSPLANQMRCSDLSLALQALMRLPQRAGATRRGTTESAQRPDIAILRSERPSSQPQPPKALTDQ